MEDVITVNACHINNASVVDIRDSGGQPLVSGVFETKHTGKRAFIHADGQRIRCFVTARNYDPAIVGKYPGQERFTWKGVVEHVKNIPGWKPPKIQPCESCLKSGGKVLSAEDVRHFIAHGMILRVPHNVTLAATLERRKGTADTQHPQQQLAVPGRLLPELLGSEGGFEFQSSQLGKLNRDGYPALSERKPGQGWKSGWAEMGLDGSIADWYLMVQ
jgi:hypothetical protein